MGCVKDQSSNKESFAIRIYGERPITELFALVASEKDLFELIGQIQLEEGEIDRSGERIEKVFVEAPLGKSFGYADLVIMTSSHCYIFEIKPDKMEKVKERLYEQIPRYCQCIESATTRSSAGLVSEFYESKREKGHPYMIVITGDDEKPREFDTMYQPDQKISESGWNPRHYMGWGPYNAIRKLLLNNGFKIVGDSPHIWAERV